MDVKKTPAEIAEDEEKALHRFIFIIWQPNPKKERVKVILDDGSIRMSLRYDRFIQLMEEVMSENGLDEVVLRNISNMRQSLSEYSGQFYYNRNSLKFGLVGTREELKHILPKDIIDKVMKNANTEDIDLRFYLFADRLIKDIVRQQDKRLLKAPTERYFGGY